MKQQTPKQAAYLFFLRNAGFGYDPKTETKQQGKSRCARELAKRERDCSGTWIYALNGYQTTMQTVPL